MLEKIREGSQGTWAVVILGLVMLSFVFAGVGGYVSSSGTAAANVNGDDIPQATFERAYENERARVESQFGDAFAALAADATYLNQFRQSVLDRLIGDKLIEQAAKDLGLRVSRDQVNQQIVSMQEFQIGGQFNNERFEQVIRSVGFQVSSFREYMRSEMTRQQVARALLGSEFALNSEAQSMLELQQQTRDIEYIEVAAELFKQDIVIDETEIETYYQQNLSNYDTQEKVSLEYIEMKAEQLMANVSVSEQELIDLYDRSANDYINEEQRRASHILIEFGDDTAQAREKAEAALARVVGGEAFSAVAGEMSDDTFSAENGGDLDFFGRDVMDPAFETATFELAEIGDVSSVIESEFGFHVIKLTDIQAEQTTPFDDVKDDLELRVKQDKAVEQLYVLQGEIAELAFEMPDSLSDVAEATATEVKSTELFTRDTAPQDVANPIVVAQAFSDELVIEGVNSEIITLGENHFMVIRVKEHEPERTRALEEVKPQIETALIQEKAQASAKEWVETLLTELHAGNDIAPRLSEKSLAWIEKSAVARFAADVPRGLIEKAFSLSPVEAANIASVELANGNAGVVKLVAVSDAADVPVEQATAMQQRLGQMRAQSSYASLIEALRENADVTIYNL